MYIQITGHLEENVNYRCIPKEEYDALKASHEKLVEATKMALDQLSRSVTYFARKYNCSSSHHEQESKTADKLEQTLKEASEL